MELTLIKTKHNWIKIYVLKYRIYIYKHIHKSIKMERTEMENRNENINTRRFLSTLYKN